jgi:hypothetical protein
MSISIGRKNTNFDLRAWDALCMERLGRTVPIVAVKEKHWLSNPPLSKQELFVLGFAEASKPEALNSYKR